MSVPDDPYRGLAPEAARIAQVLGLEPLEHEGGLHRRTYGDEYSSAIYYLLAGDDFSALHALDSVEIYHWYAGAPVRLLLLHPDGDVSEPVLGPDVLGGHRPQIAVAPGVWQGSASTGDWSLIGTTMAPGFTWDGFRLADRATLTAAYPTSTERIATLTREDTP